MVSVAVQKLLGFTSSYLLIVGFSAFANGTKFCSVQKVFSCAIKFKTIPHFLLYQVQCIQFYVEVFDPFGVEFCTG
ncbi:hypothetical protein H671_2g6542 [Cricetulus griseus]|uniref:Uncharacterized protein n=1 Tax=Cricetulus griseus TaxID=10029 RepID=A0A061ICW1_CRIGR|nr:hypothetical protein H671_2g6542 [Cricetulus griseus]